MGCDGIVLRCLVLCAIGSGGVGVAPTTRGIEVVTAPSADITISFVQPGCIEAIHIKNGDFVKVGQLLIQQDDSTERVQLERLLAESADTTKIEASEASLAQKKVDLKRTEEAAKGHAATDLEVQHAQLEVRLAELSLKAAQFEHEQAKRRYEEVRTSVQKMKLKSPVDGRIEKIHVEAGESVNALAEVIRIVRIDPLWIDVPVPMTEASAVHVGDPVQVIFSSPGVASETGAVIFTAAVADAASGTLNVRIEAPNKGGRPAGEQVRVAFKQMDSKG